MLACGQLRIPPEPILCRFSMVHFQPPSPISLFSCLFFISSSIHIFFHIFISLFIYRSRHPSIVHLSTYSLHQFIYESSLFISSFLFSRVSLHLSIFISLFHISSLLNFLSIFNLFIISLYIHIFFICLVSLRSQVRCDTMVVSILVRII